MIKFNVWRNVNASTIKHKLNTINQHHQYREEKKNHKKTIFNQTKQKMNRETEHKFITKPFVSNSDNKRGFLRHFFCLFFSLYLFIVIILLHSNVNHWRVYKNIQHSNKTPIGTVSNESLKMNKMFWKWEKNKMIMNHLKIETN